MRISLTRHPAQCQGYRKKLDPFSVLKEFIAWWERQPYKPQIITFLKPIFSQFYLLGYQVPQSTDYGILKPSDLGIVYLILPAGDSLLSVVESTTICSHLPPDGFSQAPSSAQLIFLKRMLGARLCADTMQNSPLPSRRPQSRGQDAAW